MKTVLIIVSIVIIIVILGVIALLVKVIPAINKAVDMAEKYPPIENSTPVSEKMPGMDKYEYFCSDGGPFVLLPSVIKNQWKGVGNLINILSPKTDYGKACKVVYEEGSHGFINAYNSQVFVVDSPMLATHKESDGDTFYIYALVVWQTDDLDSLIDLAVNTVQENDFISTEENIQCGEDGFVFMYAGDIYGDCMYGVKDLSAKTGVYDISGAQWKNEGSEVRILKFSLLRE